MSDGQDTTTKNDNNENTSGNSALSVKIASAATTAATLKAKTALAQNTADTAVKKANDYTTKGQQEGDETNAYLHYGSSSDIDPEYTKLASQ